MLDHLRSTLRINVLAVEYPGYGIYDEVEMGGKGGGPSEQKIFSDAELVYNFALHHVGKKESDLILLGRSLGSGPASYLAALKNPGALILMSPYSSIKNVAYSKVGFLSILLADMFNNLARMPKVDCPTFIVHGQADTLIPVQQAQDLNNACGGPTFLVTPPNMTHNEFDFYEDLIRPLMQFLMQMHVLSTSDTPEGKVIKIAEEYFIPPQKQKQY